MWHVRLMCQSCISRQGFRGGSCFAKGREEGSCHGKEQWGGWWCSIVGGGGVGVVVPLCTEAYQAPSAQGIHKTDTLLSSLSISPIKK